jgi:hypothetical protein
MTVGEEILHTCAVLMAPCAVHECRIPHAGRLGTAAGWFSDHEALADAISPLDGTAAGIYVTMNPCAPALLARAANRLRARAEVTTSDKDIARRRWLLIDLDPKRPAGISSTDREHGRAITTACSTWDYLRGEFGDPIIADSGNGCHLLYPLDLPNDAAATELVKHVLAAVAARCAPEDVDVDLTVFNAARITKLYGTMCCKGDDTKMRPHRRSCILEVPGALRIGAAA